MEELDFHGLALCNHPWIALHTCVATTDPDLFEWLSARVVSRVPLQGDKSKFMVSVSIITAFRGAINFRHTFS
jgi:hypothetical protein